MRVDNIARAVRIGTSRPSILPNCLRKGWCWSIRGFGIEEATLTASWIEALTERQTIGAHVAKAGESADIGEKSNEAIRGRDLARKYSKGAGHQT